MNCNCGHGRNAHADRRLGCLHSGCNCKRYEEASTVEDFGATVPDYNTYYNPDASTPDVSTPDPTPSPDPDFSFGGGESGGGGASGDF